MDTITPEQAARFWSRVKSGPADECWPWTGALDTKGYGQVTSRPKRYGAHRLSWLLTHGPIPEGMGVLHRCDNPVCVNPAHLFLGTQADNMRDAKEKGRNARGEKAGPSGLTEAQVRDARIRYAAGDVTLEELAKEYGVTASTLSTAVSGKTWAYLDTPPVDGSVGRRQKGFSKAKLTEAQVSAIRRAYASGEATRRELSNRYGVRYTAIWNIIERNTWKHVE